jgi:hypothetical protein
MDLGLKATRMMKTWSWSGILGIRATVKIREEVLLGKTKIRARVKIARRSKQNHNLEVM